MTMASLLLSVRDNVFRNLSRSFLASLILAPLICILINEAIRYNARIGKLKGPLGLPVIGNIWDIRVNAAEKYREWAKQFGDVYQIQLGNVPVVVVNSASAARSLLTKSSFSSRPEFYTFHKVCLAPPSWLESCVY